jgi:hypothetical protein
MGEWKVSFRHDEEVGGSTGTAARWRASGEEMTVHDPLMIVVRLAHLKELAAGSRAELEVGIRVTLAFSCPKLLDRMRRSRFIKPQAQSKRRDQTAEERYSMKRTQSKVIVFLDTRRFLTHTAFSVLPDQTHSCLKKSDRLRRKLSFCGWGYVPPPLVLQDTPPPLLVKAVRATAARLTKFCMRRAIAGLLFITIFTPITILLITISLITILLITILPTLYYRSLFVSTVCLRISNLFPYLPNWPLTPLTSYCAMLKPTQNQLVMPLQLIKASSAKKDKYVT